MKTVLITGASRGIGLATAEKFLAEGWRVFGTSTTGNIAINNSHFTAYQLDIANKESIQEFLWELTKGMINIDCLVNNAGIAPDGSTEGIDLEKIRRTFEVNVFGLLDLTDKLLGRINPGGHIINITSRYGSQAMPIDDENSLGYRMSKASLNMATRFLADYLKDRQIRVSALHPGWVRSDMGLAYAGEGIGPDREPNEPAQEIYSLAVSDVESGQFWFMGARHPW
jgi:NAD(P)-dependent dehydrogenase (short-subunit alcohol dehydrogenase family)